MSSKFHPQTLDPRRAGQVTRYHTWPRLREQSVGEHSWQVARILLAVWPDAPRHVLVHCLVHDAGEVAVGDVPYPAKTLDAEMGLRFSRLEGEARQEMENMGLTRSQLLSADEHKIFKMCEFVEMWEWGLHEVQMGNGYAALVARRCHSKAYDMSRYEVEETIGTACRAYMQKRTDYEVDVKLTMEETI